ncbi:MAG TPA: cytochrome c3 family protein [Vicinamibacterales bacterium]|nr:cytochrome c3 family protein [Vicinamibacterales bacterium]
MTRTLVVLFVVTVALAGAVVVRAVVPAPQEVQPRQPAVPDAADVHVRNGVTCEACHGTPLAGSSATAPIYAPIARTAIAPLCARCHADAAYMRQFAPQVRVDQYAQYQTSVHGQQMAKGETRVATCSDCHSAHGVLHVRDTRSPVAPANVAGTCARCHADADLMTPFDRSPEAFSDWKGSVHAAALLERGDLSAPTCSTCHGSHGATPPGVDTVANVCAQCHVREAELFRASPKQPVFAAMELADCLVCHNNHAIERPDDSWIGFESPAVCAICHDETTNGANVIRSVGDGLRALRRDTDEAVSLVARAEEAGVLVEDGHLALASAREAHVRLRVLVHAFAAPPFDEVLAEGRTAVEAARAAGTAGLDELDFRRTGLAIATLFILGFLVTLYIKIRRLPPITN